MRSIILAAGQGTRLRPYTDLIPKTMVSLHGKPLLMYQKDVLKSNGINDLHVLVGYKKDEIKDSDFNKIENPEYDTTNMVASLNCAQNLFDGLDDILITYGDIIFESSLVQDIMNDSNPLAMTYDQDWLNLWSKRMDNPLDDAETFKLNDDGFVTELGKKPKSMNEVSGQYIGMIKVSAQFAPSFFNLYDQLRYTNELFDGQTFDNMYMTSYLQLLINNGTQIKAISTKNGWLEVDSVEDLERYEKLIESGEMKSICNLF